MALENASLGSTWTEAHFQQTRDNMNNTGLKIKRLYEVIGTEPVTTNRRKRGLFNTIGIGMKTLFGTMDDDDAEYYNEKIATMDLNQHRVYQLERDQLTVVRHAISDITHTFKDFRTNQDTIIKTQNYLEQLQELTKRKVFSIDERMKLYFRVLGALQIIDLICKDVDSVVTYLYLGIDGMRNNQLSSLLVAPDELIKYLKDINSQLKTGSTLTLVVTEHTIHEYYSLIRVSACITCANWNAWSREEPSLHLCPATYGLHSCLNG
ncbi:hypothetical protein J6590_036417 [Homalodisca vitripennis]|nr:hypothetical protein J6590_036417 [Homalodisca vitripennis]